MSTKNKILTILSNNKEKNISGEALANMLGLSRTSIWKGINSLRKDGYDIVGSTKLGYALSSKSDVLSADGVIAAYNSIKSSHNKYDLSNNLFFFKNIDSTNTEAKRMLLESGSRAGTVIIADSQSSGRGRLGRTFESPDGGGLYITFIMNPFPEIDKSLLITLAASICVRNAIRKLTGIDVKIKWINDVFIENKKISGILTEAVMNFETGLVENIVVGIGVNCNTPQSSFSSDVQKVAGSISDYTEGHMPVDRNMLAALLINEVENIPSMLADDSFIDDYRNSCFVIGKDVQIIRNSSMSTAEELETAPISRVIDISDKGALVVQHDDNTIEHLSNGEIKFIN